jgi:hypothetical protein
MRVLLISANTEQINMPVLPMGLACIAAAVQHAGHDVKLINLMTKGDVQATLREAFCGFTPDVMGLSVRNIDGQVMHAPNFLLKSVKEIVSHCRNLSPAPIVLGGAGYSIFPRSALDYLGADMRIRGEGEGAFVMLLERLSRKTSLSGIPGLVLRDESVHDDARFQRNPDEFPLPLPNVHIWSPPDLGNQEIWLLFQT